MDLSEAADAFLAAKLEREKADAEYKKATKRFRQAEAELRERMTEKNEFGYKAERHGHRLDLIRKKNVNVSVTLGNTPLWLEWLEKRGEQVDDYTRQEIVKGNLRSIVREALEAEGELAFGDELTDYLDTTDQIAVLGWGKYSEEMRG